MRKPRVLVVGCANMDIISTELLAGPKGDLLGVYARYEFKCGGKGANQACAAAKMGADCEFLGRVGNDEFGKILLENLKEHHVGIKNVVVDSEMMTGMAPIFIREDKGYDSYNLLGANGKLSCEDVKRTIDAEQFDLVIMQLEMPQETAYFTYEYAASKGIPVILDAGPVREWPLDRFHGILIISPNETETEFFTGIRPNNMESAAEAAKILYDLVNPKYVILKMGDKGAFLYDGSSSHMFEAIEVEEAIDTTGCGDAFTVAVALSLYFGEDIMRAVRRGIIAGSLCSKRIGAIDAQPTWEEIDEKMRGMME